MSKSCLSHLVLALLVLAGAGSSTAEGTFTLREFGHETSAFIQRPANWNGSDWFTAGVVGVSTLLIMQADRTIRRDMLADRGYYFSIPIEGGRIWGTWYVTPLVAGAFSLHGCASDNSSTRTIGLELVQAELYSLAVIELIKATAGRARPYTGKGAFTYRPFSITRDDFNSLPSGHSALAFSMSTVLSRHIRPPLLKRLVYVPATLTLISRVYQDYHWTSDVVLGAAIGYFVSDWVVKIHSRKESSLKLSAVFPATVQLEF